MADSKTTGAGENPSTLPWARTLIALVLIPLTVAAFRGDEGYVPLLSEINFTVHEAGHPLFEVVFLGNQTMTVLGGSLFQVMFPLFFATYFLWPRENRPRDVHAAMVCLWWCGINLLDVSIYLGDAVKQQLVLVSGETGSDGSFHDWHWLLLHWNVLARDQIYAHRLRSLGKFTCNASTAVAIVWTWWPKIAGSSAPAPTPEAS